MSNKEQLNLMKKAEQSKIGKFPPINSSWKSCRGNYRLALVNHVHGDNHSEATAGTVITQSVDLGRVYYTTHCTTVADRSLLIGQDHSRHYNLKQKY